MYTATYMYMYMQLHSHTCTCINTYLRYVGLCYSKVSIQQSPQKPSTDCPDKVLAKPKQELCGNGEEEAGQHDGFATENVRGPAPGKAPDEISDKESTTEIASLLTWGKRGVDSHHTHTHTHTHT